MSSKTTTRVRRGGQGGRSGQGKEKIEERIDGEEREGWKWDVGSMFACLHLAMILAILCLQYKFGVAYGWTSIWK